MDDLLTLFVNENEKEKLQKDNGSNEKTILNDKNACLEFSNVFGNETNFISNERSAKNPKHPSYVDTTLDELSKLRIVNRVTSRMELDQLLLSHSFMSCTNLAAASKKTLNALITNASPSNQNSGKTNLATIGIVFQNSGTKISSKGSAFSILKIGDFMTGSLISLFLFGDAYSKYNSISKKILDGSVIAIFSPTLLPSKPGSDTSIAFSISQIDQLVMIGKSQDYGKCIGKCRSKRNGVFTETPCKHFVDIRVSKYCSLHSKQGRTNVNFVKQMKLEHKAQFLHNPNPPNLAINASKPILFPNQTQTTSLRAPKQMIKKTNHMQYNLNKRSLSDFLTSNSKSLQNKPKMKRKIAHVEGYDGQVYIPKQSALFQRNKTHQMHKKTSLLENPNVAKERILHNQHQYSQRLVEIKKNTTSKSKNQTNSTKQIKPLSSALTSFDDIPLSQAKQQEILSKSSKFSMQAKAELFAQNRKKLMELQRKESSTHSKIQKDGKSILISFECLTCRKTFPKKPLYCTKLRHIVKCRRTITKKHTSVREERLKKHDTSGNDGSMILAAGLDWSHWKRGGT